MGTRRTRLNTLTERWRARHDEARAGQPRPLLAILGVGKPCRLSRTRFDDDLQARRYGVAALERTFAKEKVKNSLLIRQARLPIAVGHGELIEIRQKA